MAISPGSTINPGVATKLNSTSLTGAATLDFTMPQVTGYGPMNVLFQAVGTLTGLTSKLQVSLDGGTTFTDYIATFLAAATAVFAISQSLGTSASNALATPLVPGAIYRINITALTGGPADIWVTVG